MWSLKSVLLKQSNDHRQETSEKNLQNTRPPENEQEACKGASEWVTVSGCLHKGETRTLKRSLKSNEGSMKLGLAGELIIQNMK